MPCAILGLALVATAGTASRAAASVDAGDWAGPLIERLRAEDEGPTRREGRRRADDFEDGRERHPRSENRAGERHASIDRSLPAPARHERQAPTVPQQKRAKRLGTMLASLGREFMQFVPHAPPSLTGAPIRWVASADCLALPLRSVLVELAASFGPLRVNSTCRSRKHNARVGGAKRSFHLTGNAADFRIGGNARAVLAFLRARADVGGLKHYGRGVFHIDTGPRRTW